MPILDEAAVEWVDVDSLTCLQSPRVAGEDPEHTRVLAQVEGGLPPIIVHRPSMRVIDGMHRLGAAIIKGEPRIGVRFFEGTEAEAFVLAVRFNIAHGLPLSLADREAAALQIIEQQPGWSDRAIASVVGLATRTIRGLRHEVHGAPADEQRRMGRDGRSRPLSSATGRRLAAELIGERPELSLREVARVARISPSTALDVRERISRGEDPVPPSQRREPADLDRAATRAKTAPDRPERPPFTQELLMALDGLRNDPSLRLTESGRTFLKWLAPRVLAPSGWHEAAREVPPHSSYVVARVARRCAEEWLEFADHLEGHDAPA